MPADDEPLPPHHLGDFPHFASWTADPRDALSDEPSDDDHSVSGTVIRLMWDYGVDVPLWDAEGLLPQDSPWLRDVLLLSDALIADLRDWGGDMYELDAFPDRRSPEAYKALHLRAQGLAERLRDELEPRFTVDYHPW